MPVCCGRWFTRALGAIGSFALPFLAMPTWGRSVPLVTLSLALCLGLLRPALAESLDWLVFEGACPVNADDLARRVDRELIGSRSVDARARIHIEAISTGYRVTLQAARAGRKLGGKQLVAPTCGEAVDAAVLVLAIALTEPEPDAPPEAVRETPTPAVSPSSIALVAPSSPPRDATLPAAEENGSSDDRRADVLFGVETGIAPEPAPYLGAGFALPLDVWELWGGLRYGLPAEEESVETTRSERLRRDFGAIGLSMCRGAGAQWRLSLCAGGEFGVARVDRARRDGDLELETDDDRVWLAGVGTFRLAGRVGRVRPQLEFSAAAASWGPGAALHPRLRLGAGIGVQF